MTPLECVRLSQPVLTNPYSPSVIFSSGSAEPAGHEPRAHTRKFQSWPSISNLAVSFCTNLSSQQKEKTPSWIPMF